MLFRMPPTVIHSLDAYECPFCNIQRGVYDDLNRTTDIVAVTDRAYARIAPKWWPGNPGAALVIPRHHFENLYDIDPENGHAVWDLTRQVATCMRLAYDCEGISTRQHNEPAGGQDVWHLHVHVLPRHAGDGLYQRHDESRWASPKERAEFAQQLRGALSMPTSFTE